MKLFRDLLSMARLDSARGTHELGRAFRPSKDPAMTIRKDYQEPVDIGIALDRLAFIILHARAYDAQVAEVDVAEGSTPPTIR